MKRKNLCAFFLFLILLNLIMVWNPKYYNSNSSKRLNIKDNENSIQKHNLVEKNLFDDEIKTSSSLIPKNAYAIVVGISDYPGSGYDLSYCDDDAKEVYSLLINDFNFKSSNVFYFEDNHASKSAISNAFDNIAARIEDDDIFFFYYSGHGGFGTQYGPYSWNAETPHPYGYDYDNTWNVAHAGADYMRVHFDRFECEYGWDYALCGDSSVSAGSYYEALTGNLGYDFWSAYIPVDNYYIRFMADFSVTGYGFIIDKYEALFNDGTHYLCSYDSIPDSPSNNYLDSLLDSKLDDVNCSEKYVVMDSCHSGGLIPEVSDIGRYIMSACEDDEYSLEDSSRQNGVFTYYFLRSFDYATDSNGDGVKSMEEFFSYTYSNTVSRSNSLGYTHHPQEYDGISGESVLYPSFSNVSLTTYKNNLTYSFEINGNGLIQKLLVCAYNSTIDNSYIMEDLTLNPATATGFGKYYNNLTLDGVNTLKGYGIYAEVAGNKLVRLNNTNSPDFDSDSLDDVFEIMIGLNPNISDTDYDKLDDGIEYYGISDPLDPDTDDDLLLDGDEVLRYKTDPTKWDTDDDKMDDFFEVIYGLNPLADDSGNDEDDDGLDNLKEYNLGSNPIEEDTDEDGMPDGWEDENDLNLLKDDADDDEDNDGLSNLNEYKHETDPNNYDTDGDLYSDGLEVEWGTDPLNPYYSLNAVILNFAGIGLLVFSGYYVTRAYSKKKKLMKNYNGKFKIKETGVSFNAYKADINTIYKPTITRTSYSPYYRTTPYTSQIPRSYPTQANQQEIKNFLNDFIQHRLPPAKPSFSPEGRNALLYAKMAFDYIQKGMRNDALKYMILALKMGVPEPTNSQIRKLVLTSINQESTSITKPTEITAESKFCKWCGRRIKSKDNFCQYCGRKV